MDVPGDAAPVVVGLDVGGGQRELARPAGASDELQMVLRGYNRQALHASSLEFAHPETDDTVSAEAPLPKDFEELLAALREDVA